MKLDTEIFTPRVPKIAQLNVIYIAYNNNKEIEVGVTKITTNLYLVRKVLRKQFYIDAEMKVSIDIEIGGDVRVSNIETKVICSNKYIGSLLLDSVNEYLEG